MTKKRINDEIRKLKSELKTQYKPMEQEATLQKIRSLKVHGLMLLDGRDENNQRQYTDGTSIFLIKDANMFVRKENGKIGIKSIYVMKEKVM
ncbi:hypothetical protein [Paenibacillus xylanexedens]|uniref:hypothetical protein n=1 Tax=Paenibacillus xylanexedens TaxID=528191 RepID=UPI0011A77B45|nr:hypothetical protein [Paenibacillus xylanexedens]